MKKTNSVYYKVKSRAWGVLCLLRPEVDTQPRAATSVKHRKPVIERYYIWYVFRFLERYFPR